MPFESDDPGRRWQLLETSLAALQRCSTVEKEGIEFPAKVVQAAAWTDRYQHGHRLCFEPEDAVPPGVTVEI